MKGISDSCFKSPPSSIHDLLFLLISSMPHRVEFTNYSTYCSKEHKEIQRVILLTRIMNLVMIHRAQGLESNGHGLFSNYSLDECSIPDVKLQPINNLIKGSGEVSRNWKNTEEEEYLWDDASSRRVNLILTLSNSSKRDPRLYFDSERLGFENRQPDLPSTE
ncbi:unnamed protein product [Lactuca virosa]|uniref:Uncharacterized protein n=1 Tax=Lactuca virosa TaxID=75947 RepID=A0AAU9M539_9ASTR|nr:unnamed protein product [Lactuca virosa]